MSSTSCEQQGWELLGGAAQRVTRSVSGTKASHCANKGNACCIARFLVCRRLLPLGTFTPSTSRQCDNADLVQSRSLPFCTAITNFACILATPRLLCGLRGVANSFALFTILTDIICNIYHHHCTRMWTCKKACMAHQTCGAPNANHLLACGTLHTSSKSDEVMIATMCVRGTIWCNNCDHIYLVPFCTIPRMVPLRSVVYPALQRRAGCHHHQASSPCRH